MFDFLGFVLVIYISSVQGISGSIIMGFLIHPFFKRVFLFCLWCQQGQLPPQHVHIGTQSSIVQALCIFLSFPFVFLFGGGEGSLFWTFWRQNKLFQQCILQCVGFSLSFWKQYNR